MRLTITIVASALLMSGCMKNSFESCAEYWTKAVEDGYPPYVMEGANKKGLARDVVSEKCSLNSRR